MNNDKKFDKWAFEQVQKHGSIEAVKGENGENVKCICKGSGEEFIIDPNSPYVVAGFTSRKEYLFSLCEEYDLPLEFILDAADIMGEEEDFDGLLTVLGGY